MVDDLLAPDAVGERNDWRRQRVKDGRLRVVKAGGKRPISVQFPYKLFWKIKKLADANGIAFTRQVVNLCREALGEND